VSQSVWALTLLILISCVETPSSSARENRDSNAAASSGDGKGRNTPACKTTLTSPYSPTTQPYSVFLVHLETKVEFRGRRRSDVFVEGLRPLVARADELHIPLTILMHQAWVDYIRERGHVDLIRSWVDPERGGPVHEIGIHNHGPAHTRAPQSGYSNWSAEDAQAVNDFFATHSPTKRGPAKPYNYKDRYKGTITSVAANIAELTGQPVVSGCVMQAWHEWPPTMRYQQIGRASGRNGRFAKVARWTPGGTSGQYGEGYLFTSSPLTWNRLDARNGTWTRLTRPPMDPQQTFAVTIHAHNFREAPYHRETGDEYLCALAGIDPGNEQNKRRTVRDLMQNVMLPSGYVFDGSCGDGYCDAREAGSDPETANPFSIPGWRENDSTCPADCDRLGPGGLGDGSRLEALGR
jgi:hypothetical protein